MSHNEIDTTDMPTITDRSLAILGSHPRRHAAHWPLTPAP